MRVCFVNPSDDSDEFFALLVSFMRRAAEQLSIDLEVIPCHRDKATVLRQADSVLQRPSLPDYLLLSNEEGAAANIIPRADRHGLKTLLFNQGLMMAERQALGNPRELYQSWIGVLVPDDRQAGRELAETLFDLARQQRPLGDDRKLHAFGLAGTFTIASLLRLNGFRQAGDRAGDVVISEIPPARWKRDTARDLTQQLLERYPQTGVIWAASDLMALGAVEAIEAAGKSPGRDIQVGGIDWAPSAFEGIRRGTLACSLGGHFLDGAWAMVLLHDYHHGQDFGPRPIQSGFTAATVGQLDRYQAIVQGHRSNIDFTALSKVKNPAIDSYEFNTDAVLK